ncbi:heat shock protein binding protein, putative [Ricinus communis]|uniref:Heat shock protein binding protein, putative n=1 Tax=Ricinus communis TaxID=3988 RepID=B9S885_RICCO|nr:heat shock protein binding protein, putative [Ricinus communis]
MPPAMGIRRFQQPSKFPDTEIFIQNYIRYAVRQKRADAKRALKDLLFKSGATKASFQSGQINYFIWVVIHALLCTRTQDEEPIWSFDPEQPKGTDKKRQPKSSARNSRKFNHNKMKRKFRRESFTDDDDPETMFQATFGNRWYTWSFNESSFRSSTFGFEWREHPNQTHHRDKKWNFGTDTESDSESCSIGSYHDRTILGLPASGPLRIEDVKNAFRMSALKWHPDKHQGPSQAKAEEKFKLCVNAYKSLCDALS